MNTTRHNRYHVLVCLIVGLLTLTDGLAAHTASKPDGLFDMSLEDLMDITIVSASRTEQKKNQASVPVSIITAEDIHYSGLTNLYEVLQFAPGIDMVQVDRNHYSLGVRGLHDVFSDRTLTLINGRPADNIAFGGSEFLRIPLLLEDIERIEIIRGPVGAVWGANAFNGVINIITKKPQDINAFTTATHWNEFGDNVSFFRYAESRQDFAWRLSYGYEDIESSSNALDEETFYSSFPLSPGNFRSNDHRRGSVFDLDTSCQLSEQTTLTFGAGHSTKVTGDYGFLTSFRQENGVWENTRLYTKIETHFDDGATGFLQWSGNFTNQDWPNVLKYTAYENDFQAQYNAAVDKGHQRSVGINLNLAGINQDFDPDNLQLVSDSSNEQSAGIFLLERHPLNDKWEFELQARTDWYSETQTDWAGRLTAFYAADDQKHHVFRISGAKAFRTPRTSPRQVVGSRLSGQVNLVEADDLDNEEIYSIEAGYNAILSNRFSINTNIYFQRYKDLIGYTVTRTGPAEFHKAQNIGGARACGGEIECLYKTDRYQLSAWYGYNQFKPDGDITGDNPTQDIRALRPAEHKAGFTGRLFMDNGWTLNANYKYTSLTSAENGAGKSANIPEFHRLDLTVSKAFKIDNADMEVMLGVADIFNETEQTVKAIGRFYYNHETPGRTFFARLQWRF